MVHVVRFLALAPDGNTVKGIIFYEHAETPGLGGEMKPLWTGLWPGKKVFPVDAQGAATVRRSLRSRRASRPPVTSTESTGSPARRSLHVGSLISFTSGLVIRALARISSNSGVS